MIAESRVKLRNLKFDVYGKEEFKTFCTKLESLLNTVGLGYIANDEARNGTRADHLFDAVPEWLTRKIREQGRPVGCDHQQ